MLLDALKRYIPSYEEEKRNVLKVIEFMEKNDDCFERTNLSGHVTGSAFVINKDGTKTLLMHHKKLGIWVQPGGHSDGNPDTWDVAKREVIEETGLEHLNFVIPDIFDVDVQKIPANATKGEPAHLHYDIRFLIQAEDDTLMINHESLALKWLTPKELEDFPISPEIWRMVHKWQSL